MASSDLGFEKAAPFKFADILDLRQTQHKMGISQATHLWYELGNKPWYPYVYEDGSIREFLVCGSPISGMEFNALYYYASPHKGFGLDTGDLKDQDDLYQGKSYDTSGITQ